jgi:hypothetical protein
MKYQVELEGVGPIGFGRRYRTEASGTKAISERNEKCWKERMWLDPKTDEIIFNPLGLKNCLSTAAKKKGMKVPGMGQTKFSSVFRSGVHVFDPIRFGVKSSKARKEVLDLPVPNNAGSRQPTLFPVLDKWTAKTTIEVVDENITEDVLKTHLEVAGNVVGLGALRVENGGIWGRFKLKSLKKVKA